MNTVMKTPAVTALMLCGLLLAACSRNVEKASTGPSQEQRRPQQAGQPLDPVTTAERLLLMRGAAVVGDQETATRQFEAMHGDMMRAMRVPDSGRRIDPETARMAVRALNGVRSANWVDRGNLLVRVDGASFRTQRMIDDVCIALEPLGDTLAVVVNLQNAAAANHDEMATLSRNCQLPSGEHAFMQRERQMDVVPEQVRAQHRANNADSARRGGPDPDQRARDAVLDAIPEM